MSWLSRVTGVHINPIKGQYSGGKNLLRDAAYVAAAYGGGAALGAMGAGGAGAAGSGAGAGLTEFSAPEIASMGGGLAGGAAGTGAEAAGAAGLTDMTASNAANVAGASDLGSTAATGANYGPGGLSALQKMQMVQSAGKLRGQQPTQNQPLDTSAPEQDTSIPGNTDPNSYDISALIAKLRASQEQ